jgi:hypothetical protein
MFAARENRCGCAFGTLTGMSTHNTEHDSPPSGLPNQDIDEDSLPWDILCAECRYNLRGLTSKHRCPECGHPVLESLKGCYEVRPSHAIDVCHSVIWVNGCLLVALGIFTGLMALAPGQNEFGQQMCILVAFAPTLGIAILYSVGSMIRPGCRRTWHCASKRLKVVALVVLAIAFITSIAGAVQLAYAMRWVSRM